MNRGTYLEELMDAEPTDFCIGVAGYPEKHFKAPNLSWDIQHLKEKIKAGAHYVTTQMFFDPQQYLRFVDRCRDAGITVPLIPGIKVLTKKRHLHLLPSRFHVDIPESLAAEVEAAAPEHVRDIGVEWALRQCDTLLTAGAPCIHFYVMQQSTPVRRVVQGLRQLA